MSRPLSTGRPDFPHSHSPAGQFETSPAPTPLERLHRWATLVAGGEAPIPADLEPAEISIVLVEVARLRRERLVHFVARAIAQDILGDREP